jgi:threonyl-tRNA synthetase
MQQVTVEKMINITLPDGAQLAFDGQVNGFDIAGRISKSLLKQALVMEVNGKQKDLSTTLTEDAEVRFITKKDEEALEILRHDAAHILAEAVQELYPDAQVTIGPAIENGFYYDFYREESFTPEDLEKIEKRMKEIVARNEPFSHEIWTKEQAISYYNERGEEFKAQVVEAIPDGEPVSMYTQGSFTDPCRGPHLPSTGKLGTAFKLMKLAGAYWRGDSDNPMLQRIYGTAWADEKQLKAYLNMLEEAEKRDHRRIGRSMNLFHFQEEAPGAAFWHPKGWIIYVEMQNYIRARLKEHGYVEVNTPQLLDKTFWEKSGHWDKFRENMFILEDEDKTRALKPMNCPGAVQIFKQGIKSYRDLPHRMSEFGICHRNEASGALHGLMRVRAMTQDDAHIFCTEEQITSETESFCQLLNMVYEDMGFAQPVVKFSDRPEKRAGSDEVWDKAESSLMEAVKACGLEVQMNPGEGAFYGPKLEFVLKDAIGRDWQLGTLQVDFILPERLGATYIGEDGEKHHPVLLHRAIFGSLERFIGVMIEHYSGKFPVWLAPTQMVITPITKDQNNYAQKVFDAAIKMGIRAELDLRNEKINYKVREHSHAKTPYIYVVGNREMDEQTVAIRTLGSKAQRIERYTEALNTLKLEVTPPYMK